MALPDSRPYMLLFTSRRRYIGAHRIIEAIRPLLVELRELVDAIAIVTEDDRWRDTQGTLDAMITALKTPSAAQLELIRRIAEEERVQEALRELARSKNRLVRCLPRKPQARVALARPPRKRSASRRSR